MTVPAETCSTSYVTNGVTTAFPTGWRFLANAHVRARYTPTGGSPATLVEGVHYSLTGAAADTDGTLTTMGGSSPLAAGALLLERIVPMTQLVDLRQQGSFAPQVHMGMADKLAMVDQQLAARVAVLEALASLTPIASMAAQLIYKYLGTFFADVETTFAGGAVTFPVVVGAGETVTGVLIARCMESGNAALESREPITVRGWSWDGANVTIDYITGLEPDGEYDIYFLVLTMAVSP